MLNFILKYGNVTVYQWKYGEPCPVPDAEQSVTESVDKSSIDWGLDGGGCEVVSREDGGIDFGEEDDVDDVELGITVEDSGITVDGGGVASGEVAEGEEVVGKTTSHSGGKSASVPLTL